MLIIDKYLENEIERNLLLQNKYKAEIESLPRGSIEIKEKETKYYYLKFRENGKVRSLYLGKYEQAKSLIDKVEYRNHLKIYLKKLEDEHRRLLKMKAVK